LAVERLVETLTRRIGPHTHSWFPDQPHSGFEVKVLADRPTCALLTVHLDGRSTPAALAKLRRDSTGGPPGVTRPRLRKEAASAEELTLLEWAGLEAIHDACAGVQGLDAARPLLLAREDAALVMSFVEAPTLRSVILGLSRFRPGQGRYDEAVTGCALAGRWLRVFQQSGLSSDAESDRPIRQGTRAEVVEQLRAYGDFLGSRAWRRLASRGMELAGDVLPAELSVAVGHGDFAPRNVLLRRGRLTVIDPLPRWRVPVYDDLCRFLVGVRLIGEQVHSHGLAFGSTTLDALEEAAVTASLGADADRAPLRAYQLLILMDKWTAMLDNPRRDVRGRIVRRSATLADHRVRREAERLLDLAGTDR
jgi:hypothetical protein